LWISKREGTQKIGRFKLTNEYATTRENMEKGIEVSWVCPLEPVEEDGCLATRDARENLKRRVRWGDWACLAAHNEDAAIGKKKGSWIPTSSLNKEIIEHRYIRYGDGYATRTWSWRLLGFSSQSFVPLTPGEPSGA
jgi:hypothetical protein